VCKHFQVVGLVLQSREWHVSVFCIQQLCLNLVAEFPNLGRDVLLACQNKLRFYHVNTALCVFSMAC